MIQIVTVFRKEKEFEDKCWFFAIGVQNFVQSISGDNRWFFDVCYKDDREERYSVIYRSYATPEYRNFVLSIGVRRIGDDYEYKIVKQVTELA